MSGYTKLFSSILDSTVWQEAKETRLVWITMLAMKDGRQVVEASVPGLAKRAGVTLEECEGALARLKEPDPYSRTQEHAGRRIQDVDGGWFILNGTKYREALSAADRRAYKAAKQREYRAKAKELERLKAEGDARAKKFEKAVGDGKDDEADEIAAEGLRNEPENPGPEKC
jgi:hypothetical protein